MAVASEKIIEDSKWKQMMPRTTMLMRQRLLRTAYAAMILTAWLRTLTAAVTASVLVSAMVVIKLLTVVVATSLTTVDYVLLMTGQTHYD